jgi:outer membrane protein TolC
MNRQSRRVNKPDSQNGCFWPVLRLTMLAAGWSLLTGCSTYHAQPLDRTAVDAALQPPKIEAVRIAAEKLHHPLLKPIAIDGRDGFTPDELAVMAVIVSPGLRALRDQRGVAQAQVLQAGLLPNPQLGYTFDQQHGNHDPTLVNGNSLGLDWEITALLGYRDRVASAKSTAAALDLGIAWREWQVAQEARLSAFRLLSLEGRLTFARETERERADVLALAKKAFAVGAMTTSDLAAATEAWSTAQDARFALEQALTAQRLALNLALGQPADQPVMLKAGAGFPELPPGSDNAASLLDGLEQRRLDLVALTIGYQSAEAALRAAVKAQFPRIGLSFGKARDTSDVHTRSFGLTVDLPFFDRNQGQIALGSATRQQLFDEYVARVAEARADVMRILSDLAILRTQLQTIDAGLPELERLGAALDQAMQTRNADAAAWRDAHGALLTRRAERAKMQEDILELGVALEIATGRPLLATAVGDH